MKPNYLIIPIVVLATAFIGGQFTDATSDWYRVLAKPPWTPPGSVIGVVWTVLFILLAVSALIGWKKLMDVVGGQVSSWKAQWFATFFIWNVVTNIAWSYLFFYMHDIAGAVIDSVLLGLSVIALILFLWRYSRLAASLLIPHAAWVIFATYLTATILSLNR